MFTGFIQTTGKIEALSKQAGVVNLEISASNFTNSLDFKIGESICINGICLTVVSNTEKTFTVQAVLETLAKTTLFLWKINTIVNLERALRVSDRLDGHWVSGHVDGIGKIEIIKSEGLSNRIFISHDIALGKYIAYKGSVTVDGISLTVAEKNAGNQFAVALIPHTFQNSNGLMWKRNQLVNIETDMIARYLENFQNYAATIKKNDAYSKGEIYL